MTTTRDASPGTLEPIDYDIHGIVGIRLSNCPAVDAAAVARRLGPLRRDLLRNPDIVVRFEKHIETPRLQYLGLNRYAFTNDALFVLARGTGAKTSIALEKVVGPCEVVCESGAEVTGLLTTLIHLVALQKDYVALHASAFVYKGTGVLVTGWPKGGNTESLLAFAAQGATYVGHEWILLSGDGRTMYGIPGLIRLSDCHLKHLPHFRHRVKLKDRLLLKAIRWLDVMQRALPRARLGNILPIRFLHDALPKLNRRLGVEVEPQHIFTSPLGSLAARLDKVFVTINHAEPGIHVEATDSLKVAVRTSSSTYCQQLRLLEHCFAYKFAFPQQRTDFIDRAPELHEEILLRALAGKEAYLVLHPHPVSLPLLFETMRPFCEAIGGKAAMATATLE